MPNARSYLLHLSQRILMRWKFAIETKELLLFFGEFLSIAVSSVVPTGGSNGGEEVQTIHSILTLISTLFLLAGSMLAKDEMVGEVGSSNSHSE